MPFASSVAASSHNVVSLPKKQVDEVEVVPFASSFCAFFHEVGPMLWLWVDAMVVFDNPDSRYVSYEPY